MVVQEDCPYTGGDLCTVAGTAVAVAVMSLNGEAGTYSASSEYATFNDAVYPGIWCYPAGLQDTFVSRCGEADKDLLLEEYYTPPYATTQKPACVDLVINVTTAHFSYSELNTGTFQHAILRGELLGGIECVRAENGGTPLNCQ
jgi:hypothetical protein